MKWETKCFRHNKSLIRVKMCVSLIWRAITESWIIQKRRWGLFSISNQHMVSLAFYVCLPLSSICLHNHLLTLISASFSHFVLLYTSSFFTVVPPIEFNATSPCSLFFSFSAFIWHAHWHSHSLSCPSFLHWWVVIDYCTWIVWWNATRPPNILLSAAPDIPLPPCIADCLFSVTLTMLNHLAWIWIHIWNHFSVSAELWSITMVSL